MTYTTPGGTYYTLFKDMLEQPHLLIAGATGSGKSVAINGLIATALYKLPGAGPDRAQFILIDPKRVELADYADMPHTLAHASGFDPAAWLSALNMALDVMEHRYNEMKMRREKLYSGGDLYIFIDEWADIYTNGGKACVNATLKLLSEGRAAKVHVIMATQVPTTKIIPSHLRENFSARLALRTNNAIQSRVILGEDGCECLPRYGQGFYFTPEGIDLYEIPYVQQDELDRLTNHWRMQKQAQKKKHWWSRR